MLELAIGALIVSIISEAVAITKLYIDSKNTQRAIGVLRDYVKTYEKELDLHRDTSTQHINIRKQELILQERAQKLNELAAVGKVLKYIWELPDDEDE